MTIDAALMVDRELLRMTRRFMSEFGVLVSLSQRGGRVAITHIEVVPDWRGQGRARRVLEEICEFADTHGIALAVTPSGSFGADPPRLAKLFASLGFYVNLSPPVMFQVREPMLRDPMKLKGGDGR